MKPSPHLSDDQDFEQTLAEMERSLETLKARYAQVKTDQKQQEELRSQLNRTQQELRRGRSKPLRAELKRIQQQLEELEVALESQLFSWNGMREIFWQAVRFGGMGMVLGWLMRSI